MIQLKQGNQTHSSGLIGIPRDQAMQPTVRLATPNDVSLIAPLHDLLHDGFLDRGKLTAGLERIVEGDPLLGVCFVAEINEQLIGVSELKPIFDTWDGVSGDGYVDNVSVAEPFRKEFGVGTAMLDATKQEALSRGMKRLRLFVAYDNPHYTGAVTFYGKNGFKSIGTFMEWEPPAPGTLGQGT